MTEDEKRAAGLFFCPGDPALKAQKLAAHKLSRAYNDTDEDETDKREEILARLLGGKGPGTFLQGPITFHYGVHTTIGARTYINFHFTVQDDAAVTVGDDCNIGPNVTIVTPIHPLLPEERFALRAPDGTPRHVCRAEPVVIGRHCWIGAGVTICPGVTIGDGCVIGAGSVVTRDLPPMTLAVGVPCRPLRTLTEADSVARTPGFLGDLTP